MLIVRSKPQVFSAAMDTVLRFATVRRRGVTMQRTCNVLIDTVQTGFPYAGA